MQFEHWLERSNSELFPLNGIPQKSILAVLTLAAEGCTLPFIARYRKEMTGNLNEVQIRDILEAKESYEKWVTRKSYVLEQIEKQGKLTDELKAQIENTTDLNRLEDLFLPYKPKRRSKASLAREAGLEQLADWIWGVGHGTVTPEPGQTLELWAFTFKNEAKGFADAVATIEGASHILIEKISEDLTLRQTARSLYFEKGLFVSKKGKKAKPHSKFEPYFEFQEKLTNLQKPENSHRYLAMRRGWIEEEITLSVELEETDAAALETMAKAFALSNPSCPVDVKAQLEHAATLALKAHIIASIDTEVHSVLREIADEKAIAVFAENLRRLLLAAPFGAKATLGIDPGVRTGCKLAVVDSSSRYVASTVVYLQSDEQKQKARELLIEVCKTGNIQAIAVGNGTGGRETETFVRKTLKDAQITVPVVMVSEAGASVYSASDVARAEFPDLDLTVRGAISIARRLQDPLAELIKIDPKSIGVGQYQHDVSQPRLKRSLDFVVDSCVNSVGVNLNTASPYLLSHVSGIGETLAEKVIDFRIKNGQFKSREDLKLVSGFGPKTFEQAAGFLRIPESSNPLDNTGIHPERYPLIERAAETLKLTLREVLSKPSELGQAIQDQAKNTQSEGVEIGEFTLKDILEEIKRPGRDPRDTFVPVSFRDDIFELKDLQPGMMCPGIVTNVTQFGAFVDIGVHQDGLVHLSQISSKFIKDPSEVLKAGDAVQVRILEINLEKKQISLSMKPERSEKLERPTRDRTPREAKKPALVPGNGPTFTPRDQLPKAAKTSHHERGRKGPKTSGPTPKSPFNNAFAGLASLRDKLHTK